MGFNRTSTSKGQQMGPQYPAICSPPSVWSSSNAPSSSTKTIRTTPGSRHTSHPAKTSSQPWISNRRNCNTKRREPTVRQVASWLQLTTKLTNRSISTWALRTTHITMRCRSPPLSLTRPLSHKCLRTNGASWVVAAWVATSSRGSTVHWLCHLKEGVPLGGGSLWTLLTYRSLWIKKRSGRGVSLRIWIISSLMGLKWRTSAASLISLAATSRLLVS